MKGCLLSNLRFAKQFDLLATEAGAYNSDVIGIRKNCLYEYEIKTSEQDLKNDFNKRKHKVYLNEVKGRRNDWKPHFFYFAVPEYLKDFAITKTLGKPYGVIIIADPNPKWITRRGVWCVDSVKRWVNEGTVKDVKYGEKFDLSHRNKIYQNITAKFKEVLPLDGRVKVVKRAKQLRSTDVPICDRVYVTIAKRTVSELANNYQQTILKETDKKYKDQKLLEG